MVPGAADQRTSRVQQARCRPGRGEVGLRHVGFAGAEQQRLPRFERALAAGRGALEGFAHRCRSWRRRLGWPKTRSGVHHPGPDRASRLPQLVVDRRIAPVVTLPLARGAKQSGRDRRGALFAHQRARANAATSATWWARAYSPARVRSTRSAAPASAGARQQPAKLFRRGTPVEADGNLWRQSQQGGVALARFVGEGGVVCVSIVHGGAARGRRQRRSRRDLSWRSRAAAARVHRHVDHGWSSSADGDRPAQGPVPPKPVMLPRQGRRGR